mgnify:FL=1
MEKFKIEREFYAAHKKEWVSTHLREFVLIKGNNSAGFYSTFESAFEAGLKKYGAEEDFFIKEIVETEPLNFVFLATNDHSHI